MYTVIYAVFGLFYVNLLKILTCYAKSVNSIELNAKKSLEYVL